MNKKTLNALKKSIDKWYHIAYKNGRDYGTYNCQLCMTFYESSTEESECKNCPVFNYSKTEYCGNTPYIDWQKLGMQLGMQTCDDKGIFAKTKQLQSAAIKEFEFLITLLPEGESYIDEKGYHHYWKWQQFDLNHED